MKRHLRQQLDALDYALRGLDEELVEKLSNDCVTVINNGGKIVATGLGKNVPICEKFVGTLQSLSIGAHFLNTNSAVHGDLGAVNDGDLVIILSKSGETDETVYLASLLSNIGTTNWLLTCSGDSTVASVLGSSNQVVIPVEHEGDPWNLVPNNSSMAFLVFLQALSMKLIDAIPVNIDDFKRNHPGGHIGKLLNEKENKN